MPRLRVLDIARNAYLTLRGRFTPAHTTQEQPVPAHWTVMALAHSTMQGHSNKVWAVAFFQDGQRVVTGSWDHTLRIWDVQKGPGVLGGLLVGHEDWVQSVAISPDDRLIASCGNDATIILWDVKSKQMVFGPLVKHTSWVYSVCFSVDGKRLASGSDDSTVVVWDAETGTVLATLDRHRYSVHSVAFSPDGLKLASGSADHSILVWRTDTAELLLEINAHKQLVRSVVWSPDSRQLVSASFDRTIKFWDSSNGDQIGEPCTGHSDCIYSLVMSSDGTFIATASLDQTVLLWSVKSRQQIGKAVHHSHLVRCVAISPSGELLVSGDDEGKVQLWSIENILSTAFGLDSSYDFFFARRSQRRLERRLYAEALEDAEKVIELNPSGHLGYKLKHAALHGAQLYDEATEAYNTMLSKLNDTLNLDLP